MSILCVHGGDECVGCGECGYAANAPGEDKERGAVARCACCEELIFDEQDIYLIEGDTVCPDCLHDYMQSYRTRAGHGL